jgi:hypothetical protein
MIVTAWNNGGPSETGTGYGIRQQVFLSYSQKQLSKQTMETTLASHLPWQTSKLYFMENDRGDRFLCNN